MRAKNQACEVKEQKNEEQRASEQREFASYFSLLAKQNGLESAWRAYCSADLETRELFRAFRSDNGVLDFPVYLQRIQDSRPCGMADKVEKLRLMEAVNAELERLSNAERKSYLNGKLLTLEL